MREFNYEALVLGDSPAQDSPRIEHPNIDALNTLRYSAVSSAPS